MDSTETAARAERSATASVGRNGPALATESGQGAGPGVEVNPALTGSLRDTLVAYSRKEISSDKLMREVVGHSDWFVPALYLATAEGPNEFEEVVIFNGGEYCIAARELWAFTDWAAAERAVAQGARLGVCASRIAGTRLFGGLSDRWDVVRINPGSPEELFLTAGGFDHAAVWADALTLERGIAAQTQPDEETEGEWRARMDRLARLMAAYQDFLVLEHDTTGQLVTLPSRSGEGFLNPLVMFTAPDCRDAFLDRLSPAQRGAFRDRNASGAGVVGLSPESGMDAVIVNPCGPGPTAILPLGLSPAPRGGDRPANEEGQESR